MKLFPWHHWRISTRLILMAITPVVTLFLSSLLYAYSSRLSEVQADLAERGMVIASSMAESSEYGLISGNYDDLERIASGVAQADKTISKIVVLTADKKEIVHVSQKVQSGGNDRLFEVPVKKRLIRVDDLRTDELPLVTGEIASVETAGAGIVGYIQVRMTPTTLVAKQTQRLYVQSAISLLGLLISTFFALYLAKQLHKPMATAIDALRKIRGGNFNVNLAVREGGEIGELLLSINKLASAIDEAKHRLEDKVTARTIALEASRNEAVSANAEKRKLIQKVNTIVEEERKAIAVEIHDELNAALITIQLDLQRILTITEHPTDRAFVPEIRERAQTVINTAATLYSRGRNLVRRLRPEVLDILGLEGAVEDIVNSYDELHPSCQFVLKTEGDLSTLNTDLSLAAYRIIQESLSNIVKHAKASQASVRIVLSANGSVLDITVADNGMGFDKLANTPGIGLIGIQERVHALNGQLVVRTDRLNGTSIAVRLPTHSGDAVDA